MQIWWAAAAMALVLLLYTFVIQVPVIHISTAGIKLNIIPGRHFIRWGQLNNLILKDDLLTIDLKNNKLIQQYLDESSGPVNEKEFNDFCQKQLNQ